MNDKEFRTDPKFKNESFARIFAENLIDKDHATKIISTKSLAIDIVDLTIDTATSIFAPQVELSESATKIAGLTLTGSTGVGDAALGFSGTVDRHGHIDHASAIGSTTSTSVGIGTGIAITLLAPVETPVATVVGLGVGAVGLAYFGGKAAQSAYEYFTETENGRKAWKNYTTEYHYATGRIKSGMDRIDNAITGAEAAVAAGATHLTQDISRLATRAADNSDQANKDQAEQSPAAIHGAATAASMAVQQPVLLNDVLIEKEQAFAKNAASLSHSIGQYIDHIPLPPKSGDNLQKSDWTSAIKDKACHPFTTDDKTGHLTINGVYDVSAHAKNTDDLKQVGVAPQVIDRLQDDLRHHVPAPDIARRLNQTMPDCLPPTDKISLQSPHQSLATAQADIKPPHSATDSAQISVAEQIAAGRARLQAGYQAWKKRNAEAAASFVTEWDKAHAAMGAAGSSRNQSAIKVATNDLAELGQRIDSSAGLRNALKETLGAHDRPALKMVVNSHQSSQAALIVAADAKLHPKMAQATTPPSPVLRMSL